MLLQIKSDEMFLASPFSEGNLSLLTLQTTTEFLWYSQEVRVTGFNYSIYVNRTSKPKWPEVSEKFKKCVSKI